MVSNNKVLPCGTNMILCLKFKPNYRLKQYNYDNLIVRGETFIKTLKINELFELYEMYTSRQHWSQTNYSLLL